MNLVYSDGFHTAVVEWADGVLADSMARNDRGADMAVDVWQAGDAVISVACDCGQDRMARIKDELPEQQAYRHTIAAKIRDGLARLAEVG